MLLWISSRNYVFSNCSYMKCVVQASLIHWFGPCHIPSTNLLPCRCELQFSLRSYCLFLFFYFDVFPFTRFLKLSFSFSLIRSLTANNVGSSLNGRLSEPNVSHSRSLPCLVKETDEETIGAAQQPNQLNPSVEQRTPLNPIQHRSVSLSTLQAQVLKSSLSTESLNWFIFFFT